MKRPPFIIIVVVAVYCAIIVFVLWPFWKEAQDTKAEIAQSHQLLQTRQNDSGVNDEFVYTQLQAKADALDHFLLQTKNDVDFFDHIESLAKNEGVVASLRFLQEPTPEKMQVIVLEVSIDGSYQSTMSFLTALEVQPFVVSVTDVTMQVNDQTAGTIRSTATFQTLWE